MEASERHWHPNASAGADAEDGERDEAAPRFSGLPLLIFVLMMLAGAALCGYGVLVVVGQLVSLTM